MPSMPTLLFAGLNAHGQLGLNREPVVRNFTPLALRNNEHDSVDVVYAGWSTIVLQNGRRLWSVGYQKLDWEHAKSIRCAWGNHSGIIGILDENGGLFITTPSTKFDEGAAQPSYQLEGLTTDESPRLSYVAYAANERVAVTFKQAPNCQLCHVVEFSNKAHFLSWYGSPSDGQNRPSRHHMLPGRPVQLLANMATFLLLMADGQVYSWGDARYMSLGRPLGGDGATTADQPGFVHALGGLRITKIASGGWMSAALSEDGALYLWGADAPDSDRRLRFLPGPGDVALVNISSSKDEDPLDVVDIAIGHAHLITLVSTDGRQQRLFAAGDNRCGQLGIGALDEFYDDWVEVMATSGVRADVRRTICGPKSTIVIASAAAGCQDTASEA